jgi:regulatory protein
MKLLRITHKKTYYEVATEFAVYEVDGELLRQYHLQEGQNFDEKTLAELHKKSRFRRAYRRACYLLDNRDYSYCMMYQKLMQNYQDKELCIKVMHQLAQCGAIDDRRYAKRLTEYLVECKHYGIYRIRQELLRKGIDKELTEQCLKAFQDEALKQLPAVLEKKYGSVLTDPDDFKTREKVIAGMSRLGYDFSSVKNAIDDYFQSLEQED